MAGLRLTRVSRLCAEVSGWLVIPMMFSIFLDAVLRGVFNVALLGVVESNSLLLVTLIYMGLAGAQASGANFRLTLVTERLPSRAQAVLSAVGWLFVLIVLAILTGFCVQEALFSYAKGETSYGLVNFPLWPSRLVVAFGLALLWLQLLLDGVVFFRDGRDPFAAFVDDGGDAPLPRDRL